MNHTIGPVVTPSLTLDERYQLLAHVFRLQSLFALAGPRLHADLFSEADEPHLRIVWLTAKHAVDNYGPGLLSGDPAQARTVLQTAARAYAASYPHEMPPEYSPYLDEFFEWAYGDLAAGLHRPGDRILPRRPA